MNSRERLETTLAGHVPDRAPVSLWRHFPVDDQSPGQLASSTASFQKQFQFDFIKVTPASSFCISDWGVEDRWNGSTEGTRDYTVYPIKRPDDWLLLKELDPRQGSLGRQLTCLQMLVEEFRTENIPIIQTVFSPLAQAKNLVGRENLLIHMRQHPDAVMAGLKTIARTTIRFIEELNHYHLDGIFYAVQHAQYALLNEEEFALFGKSIDFEVLQAEKSMWFNMLHLHGENVMFDLVCDYPVQVINWHDRHTPPSLSAAGRKFSGTLCGGLRRWETMVRGTPSEIETEARDALQSTEGKRFILGTGCVLPIVTPVGNIYSARKAVNQQ